MIFSVKKVEYNKTGSKNDRVLEEIDVGDIKVGSQSIMSIDGGTSNTGLSIIDLDSGELKLICSAKRERNESQVEYKVRLKDRVYNILKNNSTIRRVFYEEPFIGYPTAVANLFMLRVFIEEIIVEHSPVFDYIKYTEINNMRWKKLFLKPDKCPSGTDLQKKAIKDKLLVQLPYLGDVSQDEIDSAAMGITAINQIKSGKEDELESRKRITPFKYNIKFIGANCDDVMIQELYDIYSGPKLVLQNGLRFCKLNRNSNFERKIYELMGSDDKVVILKYNSDHHGNITLQHRIGHLAAVYDNIYAVVWRKNRKR